MRWRCRAARLYAGGNFTTAGGNAANYIAQWNGSSWSALGSGMNSNVLCAGGVGQHAVCGRLFHDGGRHRGQLHRAMEREQLVAAGFGHRGWPTSLFCLCVCAGGVGRHAVCGGYFTTAGGNAANSIAQWNGSSWSPLGSGMNGLVSALAVSGSTLYAGGDFTTAGGTTANYIAQWNGSSWSPLGSGINSLVSALAVSGGALYAGGDFTMAGDLSQTLNYIAQWNGSNWSALGSGMDNSVNALAVSGNALYVGGDFTTAGGKASCSAAEALLVWAEIQGGVHNRDGSMTLECSTLTNYSSRLYAATNLTPPVVWQPVCTNVTGGLWQFTDTNTAVVRSKFYRLSSP